MGIDREHLRASYDNNASNRATFSLPDWRVVARREWLAGLPEDVTRIVDLGGATGRDALAFAAAGLQVTIVDLSPAHVAIARSVGITAIEADVIATGLPTASFDAAWSASMLMHLGEGELEEALAEIARIVRPGGHVRLGLWGGIDETTVWEDDFQDPPRTFVHRTDDEVGRLVGDALDLTAFWTGETGLRPEIHYQWVEARRRED